VGKKKTYEHLKKMVREIDNFPTPGVSFKDITPILSDAKSFKEAIGGLAGFFKTSKIDKVGGIDARGFLFSAPVAYLLKAGNIIFRKKGKLPHKTISREHDLEYGRGLIEVHVDAVDPGENILIIDDVLATGGTAEAAVRLVEDLGGVVVGLGFLIELPLGGREKLKEYKIKSLISY